jgi:hypothetical protein
MAENTIKYADKRGTMGKKNESAVQINLDEWELVRVAIGQV